MSNWMLVGGGAHSLAFQHLHGSCPLVFTYKHIYIYMYPACQVAAPEDPVLPEVGCDEALRGLVWQNSHCALAPSLGLWLQPFV